MALQKAQKNPKKTAKDKTNRSDRNDLPVVAIGASAGGLNAFKKFFSAMPSDAGVSFVLIQHLPPDHKQAMTELLSHSMDMEVLLAEEGMTIEPNHVYFIPPGKALTIKDGALHLSEFDSKSMLRLPIDIFFRSLAAEKKDKAICIILSGTGADGTLGMREIKALGGMAMVQTPEDADYDGMPRTAIDTGLADFVLPAVEMPSNLLQYIRHAYFESKVEEKDLEKEEADEILNIIKLLKAKKLFDFSFYKRGTISRRIQRRMSINHLEDLRNYRRLLEKDPNELLLLARDFLIGVTSFFRDRQAFEALAETAITQICLQATPDKPIRVWVPGAATGEEAYSIAILIFETLSKLKKEDCHLQMFATDIDKDALAKARRGIYPETIAADIPPARLQSYFEMHGKEYRVKKSVREAITFSEQDLVTNPPFSRMDLISCRNLLIYLMPDLQNRVISIFHFALNQGGFLFLGTAENIGKQDNFFKPVNTKWRIYQRIGIVNMPGFDFSFFTKGTFPHMPPHKNKLIPAVNIRQLAEKSLLTHFCPSGVVINTRYEILQFLGKTRDYIEFPDGAPTTNLLDLVSMVLKNSIRALIYKINKEGKPEEYSVVRLPRNGKGKNRTVRLAARKLVAEELDEKLFLVTFFELPEDQFPSSLEKTGGKAGDAEDHIIRQLENELRSTREDLENTIEQLEVANEELKAGNEEVISMNEEFQSTNEELETSKEELQALNEELSTVNNELQEKVRELETTANDLNNLLINSDTGIIFLNTDFHIKLFTPVISRIFKLIPSDIGRSLFDFESSFPASRLFEDAKKVLADLVPISKEVETADGRWFMQRVLPYRTRDNRIEGAVITFNDITQIKLVSLQELQNATYLRLLANSLPVLMAHIDSNEFHLYANEQYHECFGGKSGRIVGRNLRDVFGSQVYDKIKKQLDIVHAGKETGFELEIPCALEDTRTMWVNYAPQIDSEGKVSGIFILMRDTTEQKLAEKDRAWLAAIVDTTMDAIISRDFDGTVISWNKAAEKMFGYSAKEMIGKPINLIYPAGESEKIRKLTKKIKASMIVGPLETKRIRKDGTPIEILLTLSPITNEEGEPVAVSAISRDISDRRKLENDLRRLNEDLENKVRNRTSELEAYMNRLRRLTLELGETEQNERKRLAKILHDNLQQLLVAARMRAERLVGKLQINGQQKLAREITELLNQATENTRDLAIDIHPQILEKIDLRAALSWLTEWMHEIHGLRATVRISRDDRLKDLPDNLISILFDMVRELFFNVVKHSGVKKVVLNLDIDDNNCLRVKVADKGSGLASSPLDTKQTGSFGIGLFTIQERLIALGGGMHIETAPGKGFTVMMWLPFVKEGEISADACPGNGVEG